MHIRFQNNAQVVLVRPWVLKTCASMLNFSFYLSLSLFPHFAKTVSWTPKAMRRLLVWWGYPYSTLLLRNVMRRHAGPVPCPGACWREKRQRPALGLEANKMKSPEQRHTKTIMLLKLLPLLKPRPAFFSSKRKILEKTNVMSQRENKTN